MRAGSRHERLLALAAVAVGIGLMAGMLPQTWTTVPEQFTGLGRPVGLSGSVLQETSYAFAIVMTLLLVAMALLEAGRRLAVALALAFFAMLAFSQTLDVAVDPTKAVLRFQDTVAPELGLDPLNDRETLRALEAQDLSAAAPAWLSLVGALVAGSASVVVAVRGRRWDEARHVSSSTGTRS